jgi:Ca-activated chloride channel homolog
MNPSFIARMMRTFPAAAIAAAVAAIVAAPVPVCAQQYQQSAPNNYSQPQPPARMVIPGNQGSTGGSTLELPTNPGIQNSVPAPPPPPSHQELTIPAQQLRERPGYQQVTVTVTDQSGRYVTGLQKGDFQLSLDNQHQPIEFFRSDLNTPVSMGIVVDTSGSMQPKIPQARIAISEMIRDLNPHDDVFLYAFSNRPFLLQPFTTDHELVMERLQLLHAYGQTSLYDAVISGLQMLQRGRFDKKALLVVTDGMDNTSLHDLDDVVGIARRQGVLIYSIGIGNPNAGGTTFVFGPLVFGGGEDEVDAKTLKELAVETGGKNYIIQEVGDGAALRRDCAEISEELRQQYTLGFVAPDPGAGGYRNLHVDVPGHPEATARVRKGVEVSGHSSYASGPAPGYGYTPP